MGASCCQFTCVPFFSAVELCPQLCPRASGCLTPKPSMSLHYIHHFTLIYYQNLVSVTQLVGVYLSALTALLLVQ